MIYLIMNYTLEGFINKGSFGHVYKIKDSYNNIWALKIIDNTKYSYNEIDILTHIRKSYYGLDINICIMEYYTYNNMYINFMFKYYDSNLSYLVQNYILSSKDINNICLQICNGLRYIHKLNIVHCDIKPANILCNMHNDKQKYIKVAITDFGLSYYNNTKIYSEVVTSDFRSPEIINCLHYNAIIHIKPAIDMWSFGIVIYYIIYKKILFEKLDEICIYNYIKRNPILKMKNIKSVMDRLLQYENNRYDCEKTYILLNKI
ncbi:ser/thr kinase (Cop-B1R) [Adoxophyes honmai entomopoxvirus 'L']|uniref:Ser/thr kinase (Cop-B1R) n=1 Tax=Adoxophyes honmai entomopoxvirus 'L' TaxID=1293540 RepID=A0A916KP05_9POXV|nr:ser/thr kinase (Cop-B1R) [Adoxophyes honmai entomopoxvirus 'L']CCU55403.1 ser/thr kinase (Cop-B1R) [Adoxophyes honmai entomopoxvirus 'L']